MHAFGLFSAPARKGERKASADEERLTMLRARAASAAAFGVETLRGRDRLGDDDRDCCICREGHKSNINLPQSEGIIMRYRQRTSEKINEHRKETYLSAVLLEEGETCVACLARHGFPARLRSMNAARDRLFRVKTFRIPSSCTAYGCRLENTMKPQRLQCRGTQKESIDSRTCVFCASDSNTVL